MAEFLLDAIARSHGVELWTARAEWHNGTPGCIAQPGKVIGGRRIFRLFDGPTGLPTVDYICYFAKGNLRAPLIFREHEIDSLPEKAERAIAELK